MERAQKIREVASRYRELAEQAGNPWIRAARLRAAEELEVAAAGLDCMRVGPPPRADRSSADLAL